MKAVQLSTYIKIVAGISIISGLLVIIGWLTDNEGLKSVVAGLATMKFNTAISFILSGGALFLLSKNAKNHRYIQTILLLIVALLGLITFCEYVFNFNSGLDELFVKEYVSKRGVLAFPGRMAETTALCFLLTGFAIIGISSARISIKRIAQYALHFVTLISFIALIGYLYDIPSFYKLSFFSSMALNTSVLFFLLSIATSLLNPSFGIVNLLTGKSTGSIMAKRLFPLITIIILVLGFMRLQLHRLNLVSEDFGIALFATSSIIVSLSLIAITAVHLDKIDAKRRMAEESLRTLNMKLKELVDEKTADLVQITERLSLATKGSKIGVWDWDIINNKLTWDDKMYKLYGIAPSDFSGAYEAWENGLHPDDKERGRHAIEMAIAGEMEFDTEFRVLWPDKSVHHIKAKSLIQRDAAGKAIRMIGTNWDITEGVTLQKKLIDQKEQNQKTVLITAIESQEKERKQIGFELTENVNQILTAANMHLGLIKKGDDVHSLELINESKSLITKAVQGIRKLAYNIGTSHIDEIGITEALNDIVYKINALHIFKVELKLSIEDASIPGPVALSIYRFVQEQLNNILNYAEASAVIIQLYPAGDYLVLEISDNGKGANLDEVKKGMGLSIMQNRAKAYNEKVKFETFPGKGFRVVAKLPMKEEK